jgi:hypothetical protein
MIRNDKVRKLPLWRWIAGIGVLGGFAAVIGFLTPVYLDDMRLHQYVVSLQSAPNIPDATVQSEIVARAHELDLPVRPDDIHIVHNGSKIKIEMKYVVEVHLAVYPVDLHFPTIR